MNPYIKALLLMILMGMMTAGGQVLLKLGLNGGTRRSGVIGMVLLCLNKKVLSGLVLALAAPLVYIRALTYLGLSGVYGFNGLTYFFVFVFSRIVLKEKGSLLHLAGLILIAGGIVVWSI